jgi:opacity protein-like surface antigen
MRVKAAWILTGAFLTTALPSSALADLRRAGRGDLLFGLGSLASQEADIGGGTTLDAGDGVTVDLRFRFHFSENLGLEIGGTGETERTRLRVGGVVTDSLDTEIGFLFANIHFDLVAAPVTPYVSMGVGRFSHDADAIGVHESGPLFNAAVGVDGRNPGKLVWALEARLLHYEFDDFEDNWNRIQFSGQVGFHF